MCRWLTAQGQLVEQGPAPLLMSGGPMTPKAFHALFARIGAWARMPFPVHPHMLRHACGYALANARHDTRSLQAYLGHKNIQHTVRYSRWQERSGRGVTIRPDTGRVTAGPSWRLPRCTGCAESGRRHLEPSRPAWITSVRPA